MTLPTIITSRLGVTLPSFPSAVSPAPAPPPENSAADAVGVFDDEFNQVFAKARPLKADVYEAARVMDHPVESGSTMTDHRVIDPIEIELALVMAGEDYRDTYNQVKDLYNRAALLVVQTRSGSYSNMLISAMPHDESPDSYDTINMSLRLREAILVTVQFQALPPRAVAQQRNTSTVRRGQQTGTAEPSATAAPAGGPTEVQSTARRLRDNYGNGFVRSILGGG